MREAQCAGATTNYHPEARKLLPPLLQDMYPAIHSKGGHAISLDLYNDIERHMNSRLPIEALAEQVSIRYHDRFVLNMATLCNLTS